MMDRRRLLLTSVAGALTRPLVAGAQQGTKVWRIGVLSTADGPEWNAFRQGLRTLGYTEGRSWPSWGRSPSTTTRISSSA